MKQLGARLTNWMFIVLGGPAHGPLTVVCDHSCVLIYITLVLQRPCGVHDCMEPCFSVDSRRAACSDLLAVLQEVGLCLDPL